MGNENINLQPYPSISYIPNQYEFNETENITSTDDGSIFEDTEFYNGSQIDKITWVDDVYDVINTVSDSTVPDWAYGLAPKGFILQTESGYDFIADNELAFESLPRTEDGELDVAKIQSSLATSVSLITERNNEATEMLDYGIYRDAINNTSLLVALLGPEVANLVTTLGGDSIPDWATNGISLFDIDLNTLLNILEEADIDLSDYGINDVVDFTDIKTSYEIADEIKAQEEGLAELQNFEIKNDEDAEEFLDRYLELTGTSFFCENIDECQKLFEDENASEKAKTKVYQQACGNSNALTDAQKNQLATNICYDVGIRYLIPVAINKIDTIPTKIISTALPTVIEATEVATQGREEDEVINLRNLNYETVIDILAEGAIDGLMVNIGSQIEYGDGFINKTKGRTIKSGVTKAANLVSKAAVKGAVPNYSSWWKAVLTTLVPGSGTFFDW